MLVEPPIPVPTQSVESATVLDFGEYDEQEVCKH